MNCVVLQIKPKKISLVLKGEELRFKKEKKLGPLGSVWWNFGKIEYFFNLAIVIDK
jgi:hypothetical protein